MWPWLGRVPTYGILYGLSIISHFIVAAVIARRLGLRRRIWIAASLCYMIGMTLGAKVLFDITRGTFSLAALLSARHYMQGGLWGGLLAYIVSAACLALVLSRNRPAALDLTALAIPIPWILARLGCLLNGCCYGRPCSMPWAVTFDEAARGAPAGIALHPTQLYEIIVIVCVIAVFRILRGTRWRGTMLLWFLLVYGAGRAVTEAFRGDMQENFSIGSFSVSQLVCLAAAGASAIALLFWRSRTTGAPPQDRPETKIS